ncbi:hypothetical protein AB0D42_25075 [Streptomyces sp. NPDC048304]
MATLRMLNDVEAELAQLASQGPTTPVGLMVTEAWNQAVEQDLDETRVTS